MQAIVIGRHGGEIPGVEIIEQRAVQFPATARECAPILAELVEAASSADAALLFQAVPGQLAVALAQMVAEGGLLTPPVGVIISKPGERPAAQCADIRVYGAQPNIAAQHATLERAVRVANPNAKVMWRDTGLEGAVIADSPMKFQFSHIEWLNNPETTWDSMAAVLEGAATSKHGFEDGDAPEADTLLFAIQGALAERGVQYSQTWGSHNDYLTVEGEVDWLAVTRAVAQAAPVAFATYMRRILA